MSGLAVEPACGDGRVLDFLLSVGVPRAQLVGVDVRPEAVEQTRRRGFEAHCADWLTDAGLEALGGRAVGAIITNPPFCIDPAFARVCLDRLAPGGFVALLLRLTFLEPAVDGASARVDLLTKYAADVWVPPARARFVGSGTDRVATGWYRWPSEGVGDGLRVRYLEHHLAGRGNMGHAAV